VVIRGGLTIKGRSLVVGNGGTVRITGRSRRKNKLFRCVEEGDQRTVQKPLSMVVNYYA